VVDRSPLWNRKGDAVERCIRPRGEALAGSAVRADQGLRYPPGLLRAGRRPRAADRALQSIALTTEEEGIALAAGAWLGGQRSALLMQSSGVGNCINMLSLIRACRFPMLMLVTMRGEWEEFNPWQEPMGSIVEPALRLCDTDVVKVTEPSQVVPAVQNAIQLAFGDDRAAAVLLSQKLIGRKVWVK
jgi:sulfopyruvate decarboxylase alpha subunit